MTSGDWCKFTQWHCMTPVRVREVLIQLQSQNCNNSGWKEPLDINCSSQGLTLLLRNCWVLSISKGDDFKCTLGNLLQYLTTTTLSVRYFFCISNSNFPHCDLCLLFVAPSLCNLGEIWGPSSSDLHYSRSKKHGKKSSDCYICQPCSGFG